ncbi:MAG: right-handed parallel beta-helix repeat-containing protein [Phycisphaerales bacterium]
MNDASLPPGPSSLDRRFLLGGLAGVAGVSALAALAQGKGPINPPAGAVGSTGKTLTEVEPRIPLSQANTPGNAANVFYITQPGSYYLTGNVAVPAGVNGIGIALAGGVPENAQVTVDLMGFEIVGGVTGVFVTSAANPRITVLRNGRIRGTSGNSINALNGTNAERFSCVIEDIIVTGAGGNGILISGGTVRRCKVDGANLTGISVDRPGLIESCIVVGSTNAAFYGGNGDVTVRGCIAAQCQGSGVALNSTGVVEDCQFYSVGLANALGRRSGIYANNRAVIRNNVIDGSPLGVEVVGTRSLVTGNIVSGATVTPFVLAANNLYGPIINLAAVGTAAVNGPSAPSVLTTSDPNANFVR